MNKKTIHIFNIILVLLSMLTIFLFSSETADNSSNTSKTLVKEVVSIVVRDDDVKQEKVESIVTNYMFYIRKSAHFIEFMLLGFLFVNIAKDYRHLSIGLVMFCVLLSCLYAATDEVHQLFVDGRAARVFDVCVDTAGAFIGAMGYYGIYSIINRQNSTNFDKKV